MMNKNINGTIVRKNVDGCTWLIQLEDSTLLEPVNLSDFKITIADGQKVSLRYEFIEAMSICMMGKTVKLIFINNK